MLEDKVGDMKEDVKDAEAFTKLAKEGQDVLCKKISSLEKELSSLNIEKSSTKVGIMLFLPRQICFYEFTL